MQRWKTFTGLACAALVAVPSTFGSGFFLREQSPQGMGRAYAGGPAGLEDNSAAFLNPAAMPYAAGGLSVGISLIDIQAEFNNQGSVNMASGAPIPISGGNGGEAGGLSMIPNAYLVFPISEELSYGLAINVPFGLETDWDKDWVGRYHGIKSSLMTLNLNPSVSYNLGNGWSVGAGVSALYAEAELSSAVNLAVATSTPGMPDGFGKLEGDDWGYGYNAGVAYSWAEDARVGLHYRSKVETSLEGDATYQLPVPALAAIFADTTGSADLDLPDQISFGYVNGITEKITVACSVDWTGWSSFEELRVEYASAQPDSVTDESWDDTLAYAIGFDYAHSEDLTLRAGFMFDESPVPDDAHRTPRIPDTDRYWYTVGLTWQANENSSIDAGYAFLHSPSQSSRHMNATGDVLVGDYDSMINILSLQYNWMF